ncbi:DUF3265 domain-containing protein [Vibrio vulnificus]|nr:DUF3265 domain-containing protein [Vibrio vulnificus]
MSKMWAYYLSNVNITRRLSGIHAAWHFWFAVSFGGESGLRKLGLGGTHPLTRRYILRGNLCLLHGKII